MCPLILSYYLLGGEDEHCVPNLLRRVTTTHSRCSGVGDREGSGESGGVREEGRGGGGRGGEYLHISRPMLLLNHLLISVFSLHYSM